MSFDPFKTTTFTPSQIIRMHRWFQEYPEGTINLGGGDIINWEDYLHLRRENLIRRCNRGLNIYSNPDREYEIIRFAQQLKSRCVIHWVPARLRKRFDQSYLIQRNFKNISDS